MVGSNTPSCLHWLHKRTTRLIFQFLGSLQNCQTWIGPKQHASTHSTVGLHCMFDHWRCCEPFPNGKKFQICRFQTNLQTDSLPSGFQSSIQPKACARFYKKKKRRSGQVDQDSYLVAVHRTTEPIEKAKTTGDIFSRPKFFLMDSSRDYFT